MVKEDAKTIIRYYINSSTARKHIFGVRAEMHPLFFPTHGEIFTAGFKMYGIVDGNCIEKLTMGFTMEFTMVPVLITMVWSSVSRQSALIGCSSKANRGVVGTFPGPENRSWWHHTSSFVVIRLLSR